MTGHFRILTLPSMVDPRGQLTVLDNVLPFDVLRAFWITRADGQTRGGHRHYQTRQALIAMAGSVDVIMDDGPVQDVVRLTEPNQRQLVAPKDWHTMTFGPSAILLVLSSHHFERADFFDEPYTPWP